MESIVIMAGGASSRMKKSIGGSVLSEETKQIILSRHKSLIPLGKSQKPLLFHLIQNAVHAGYKTVYLITSPENEAFQQEVGRLQKNNTYAGATVHYALQYTPENREKPLGTADAVLQAMEQYPELQNTTFTVCNGDNLYSRNALTLLRTSRTAPHAMISYARSGLQFSNDRIASFAIMDIDTKGFVKQIIEKPDPALLHKFHDETDEIRISMNVFSFNGELLYPFVKECPLHPERGEKELPEAVRRMILSHPEGMMSIPLTEHIPDLTSAEDLTTFNSM
jgi:NDP-sugar pyrophosphorylase family protein